MRVTCLHGQTCEDAPSEAPQTLPCPDRSCTAQQSPCCHQKPGQEEIQQRFPVIHPRGIVSKPPPRSEVHNRVRWEEGAVDSATAVAGKRGSQIARQGMFLTTRTGIRESNANSLKGSRIGLSVSERSWWKSGSARIWEKGHVSKECFDLGGPLLSPLQGASYRTIFPRTVEAALPQTANWQLPPDFVRQGDVEFRGFTISGKCFYRTERRRERQ